MSDYVEGMIWRVGVRHEAIIRSAGGGQGTIVAACSCVARHEVGNENRTVRCRDVFIQIAADRLAVAAGDGESLRIEHTPISLSDDPAQWIKSVSRLGPTVAELVERAEIGGTSATRAIVLYESPTSRISVESLPDSGSFGATARAIEAAKLSCLETMTNSSAALSSAAFPIGRDRYDGKRRIHVAVAAERDDALAAIADCVEGGGLTFAQAIPIDAPLMVQLGQSALNTTSAVAQLYIGERSSLFFIASENCLLFARRIAIGIQSFVNVLTRPIRIRSGQEPITLNERQARRILFEHGMPAHDAVVLAEPELRGVQVIPFLQPVLQRVIVELRQSLRFSLTEEETKSVAIDCVGPGSVIPGLARVLASELGTELMPSDAPGEEVLADAVRERRILSDFGLMPTFVARQRHGVRLQRWLWTGAAAAAVMIAVDAVRLHATVSFLQTQQSSILAHHSEYDAFRRTSDRLTGALKGMSQIEKIAQQELQHQFDGFAVMAELSHLTPPTIRLIEMTFRRTDRGLTATLVGLAQYDSQHQTELKRYVEQIRQSPLFEEAVLGKVHVNSQSGTGSAGRAGERFEVSLLVASAPRSVGIARADAASTGGEP